jgi:hypothetical protein
MAKSTKIADVSSPGKTAPSASSRPIIVTNHSGMVGDPMIVDDTSAEQPTTAPVIKRSAKTISPVSADMQQGSTPEETSETEPVSLEGSAETSPAETLPEPAQGTEPGDQKAAEEKPSSDSEDKGPLRDTDAENASVEAAALAAEEARNAELEKLIESGEFSVPINAIQRKRSRTFVAAMCMLAVLLALLLLDALLDVHIISLPVNVPHTHLFSAS